MWFPGSEIWLPESEMWFPGSEIQLPGSEMWFPGSEIQLPGKQNVACGRQAVDYISNILKALLLNTVR